MIFLHQPFVEFDIQNIVNNLVMTLRYSLTDTDRPRATDRETQVNIETHKQCETQTDKQ